jgi:hypothetical protein
MSNVNLSDVLNKVTNMKGADNIQTNSNGITQGYETGRPIGAYYGYQVIGIFKSAAQIAAAPAQPSPVSPGDLEYKTRDKDGSVGAKDLVYLGSNIPRYTYGANLGAGYKGFDLSALLQGVGKVDINDMIMRGCAYQPGQQLQALYGECLDGCQSQFQLSPAVYGQAE